MNAVHYVAYMLVMSAVIFLGGRVFPRRWIDHTSFLYRPYSFEENGAAYEKLSIKKWKDKWPNASLLLHKLCRWIPQKRVSTTASGQFLTLIQESCVAETTHYFAIAFGFLYLINRRNRWSVALSLLNCLVNLPPIIIQRYNRPRYIGSYQASLRRESRKIRGVENG